MPRHPSGYTRHSDGGHLAMPRHPSGIRLGVKGNELGDDGDGGWVVAKKGQGAAVWPLLTASSFGHAMAEGCETGGRAVGQGVARWVTLPHLFGAVRRLPLGQGRGSFPRFCPSPPGEAAPFG